MSKMYEKTCNRCSQKIRMSDELGKWSALNLDNSKHECGKQNGNGNPNLDDLITRLESVLADLRKLKEFSKQ